MFITTYEIRIRGRAIERFDRFKVKNWDGSEGEILSTYTSIDVMYIPFIKDGMQVVLNKVL